MDDVSVEEYNCLTQAIYHESRGEPREGKLMVGFVIKNRVESDQFPDDFCDVINQPWQFSFVDLLGDPAEMVEKEAKKVAEEVAEVVLSTDTPIPESTLYFHGAHMTPRDWNFDLLSLYKRIGNHIFYRER